MKDFISHSLISGLILGAASGLLWPLLRDKLTINKKKKIALFDLYDLISELFNSISHEPHGVVNKDKWSDRIRSFRSANEDWLGAISYVLERLSWRIEDNAFTHDNHNKCNSNYCCTHLKKDLLLLKLSICSLTGKYPNAAINNIEQFEKEQLKEILFEESKPVERLQNLIFDDLHTNKVDNFYKCWKDGKLELSENLAMSKYLKRNMEREISTLGI